MIEKETAGLSGAPLADRLDDVVDRLNDRFNLAQLQGKLAKIIADIVKKHGGKSQMSGGKIIININGKKEVIKLRPGQSFNRTVKSNGNTVTVNVSGSGSGSNIVIVSGSSGSSIKVTGNNVSINSN